jgi:hypothetical protein
MHVQWTCFHTLNTLVRIMQMVLKQWQHTRYFQPCGCSRWQPGSHRGSLEGQKIACCDILQALKVQSQLMEYAMNDDDTYINVVVHNLEQGTGASAHNFNNLTERSLKGLADAARVDRTHRIV